MYGRKSTRYSTYSEMIGKTFLEYDKPILKRYRKDTVYFSSGSKYTGQWNDLGMSGEGTLVLPHGVAYTGQFDDGLYLGRGIFWDYPLGQTADFRIRKDHLELALYTYSDGLGYSEPWTYCQMPDRRYKVCIDTGLRPAGRSILTNEQPSRVIPKGCYDAGDGFFNPKTKVVFSPSDPTKIIRIPTPAEEEWIVTHCRKAWDEPTRYRPDLYEIWENGKETQIEPSIEKSPSIMSTYSYDTVNEVVSKTISFLI